MGINLGFGGGMQMSPEEKYVRNMKIARSDMILIFAMTIFNAVMLLAGGGFYFLFSAAVPYEIFAVGVIVCGLAPAEVYTGDMAGIEILRPEYLWAFAIVSLLLLSMYLVAFLFTKKPRVGWYVFAAVYMCLDTVVMFLLGGFDAMTIPDTIFHIYMIVTLINGAVACSKYNKLIASEVTVVDAESRANESSKPSAPEIFVYDIDSDSVSPDGEVYVYETEPAQNGAKATETEDVTVVDAESDSGTEVVVAEAESAETKADESEK